MVPLRSCLTLLLASCLCISCDDAGSPSFWGSAPAEARRLMSAGRTGAFAGELYTDSQIAPMAPALYLAPRQDVEISPVFYTNYTSDELGHLTWYDGNLSFVENRRRLDSFDKEKIQAIFNAYKSRADSGHVSSMLNVGRWYQEGTGTECDERMAMAYYKKAAAQQSDTFTRVSARYNILNLKLSSDLYSFDDCLTDFRNDVQSGKSATYEYGELLYLIARNKAGKNAEHLATLRAELEATIHKDKTGSCSYVSALNYRYGNMGATPNLPKALQLYQDAASPDKEHGGYGRALLALGNVYHFGLMGERQDTTKSLAFYARAASVHNNTTMTNTHFRARTALAVHRLLAGERGKAVIIPASEENTSSTSHLPAELLKEAAAHDTTAAYNHGIHQLALQQGNMSAETLGFIAKGNDNSQDDIRICARIYTALYAQNKKDAPEVTAEEVRTLEEQASPAAKTLLANCYAAGIGVERNMVTAVRLYRDNQNHDPAARHNLGLCYKQGAGIARNKQEANRLLSQAAAELRQAAQN